MPNLKYVFPFRARNSQASLSLLNVKKNRILLILPTARLEEKHLAKESVSPAKNRITSSVRETFLKHTQLQLHKSLSMEMDGEKESEIRIGYKKSRKHCRTTSMTTKTTKNVTTTEMF